LVSHLQVDPRPERAVVKLDGFFAFDLEAQMGLDDGLVIHISPLSGSLSFHGG
jgi:hypothetical protein